jgi:hypothetical protein
MYEVTNRSTRTLAETAALLGIGYRECTPAQYRAALLEHGVPDDYATNLTHLFTDILDGRNEDVTDGVERALGRPPRDLPEYVRETAATGVWTSPA